MAFFLQCGKSVPAPVQTPLYFDLGAKSGTLLEWNVGQLYDDYANLTIDDFVIDFETPNPYYVFQSKSFNISNNQQLQVNVTYNYTTKTYNPSTGILSVSPYYYSDFILRGSSIGFLTFSSYKIHPYIINEGEDNNYIVHKIASQSYTDSSSNQSSTNAITVSDYYTLSVPTSIENFKRNILGDSNIICTWNASKQYGSNVGLQIDFQRDSSSASGNYNSSTTLYREFCAGNAFVASYGGWRYFYPSYDLWYILDKRAN